MTNNTLVLFALWGTLSASVGAWVVTLAKFMWQTYEEAKIEQDVVRSYMRVSRRLAAQIARVLEFGRQITFSADTLSDISMEYYSLWNCIIPI